MADPLKTGLSGLLAFQRAIATTAHNISNANTEGYSRQRVGLTARPTTSMGFGFIGHGVQVNSVERIQDQFTQVRLQQTSSEQARTSTYHSMISRIDSLIADDNASLSPVMENFFNAVQDLNNNPSSTASRNAMLNAANNLAGRFNTLQGQFDGLQGEVNSRIGASVSEINSLASNIAKLNNEIVAAQGQASGHPPNDLLDQRGQLLDELSQLTSITTLPQDNGAVNVFIGNGLNLVVDNQAQVLSTVQDPSQPEKKQVALQTINGVQLVNDKLTGGSLGGLLDFQREALDPAINELGRIAVVMADSFNQQHQQGVDLNGNMGANFFTAPQPTVSSRSFNTGTGTATATFTDVTALSASDYQLGFDGSNYTLTRLSDNTQVSGGLPLTMDGLEINLTGAPAAGDSFMIRPTAKAARGFSVSLTDTSKIAMASPLRSEAPVSNLGTASVTPPKILDTSNPDFSDTVEIRFNSPANTYDVVNVTDGSTLSSGVAYTDGGDIDVQGWRVQVNGSPQAGDVFRIETSTGSTNNNSNGQLLAGVQNLSLVGGTAKLQESYASLVGQVGSQTRQAEINSKSMDGLLTQAREARESVSGVNLDEEAINLTRYQQAYQAAAQVITTANSMFDTLLNAVRR